MESAGGKQHSAAAVAQAEKYIPPRFQSVLRGPLEHPEFTAVLNSPRLGIPAGPVSPAIMAGCWAVVLLGAHAAIGPHNALCQGDPEEHFHLASQVATDFLTATFPGHILKHPIAPTQSLRAYLRACGENGFVSLARKRATQQNGEAKLARLARADAQTDESYRDVGEKPRATMSDLSALIARADFSDKPLSKALAARWFELGPKAVAEEHAALIADSRFASASIQQVEDARQLIIRRLRKLAAEDPLQAGRQRRVHSDTNTHSNP